MHEVRLKKSDKKKTTGRKPEAAQGKGRKKTGGKTASERDYGLTLRDTVGGKGREIS